MRTSDFNYHLPPERIAQQPTQDRLASRLLVLHRDTGKIEHRRFSDILIYLRPGDLLVVNETKVIPARLIGRKAGTGGRAEALLLRRRAPDIWQAAVSPGRRLGVGVRIEFAGGLIGEIISRAADGTREIKFSGEGDIGAFKRYRTETTLQHLETGEEIKEPFTILSDRPLSLKDIYGDARDHLPKYPYIEEYVIVDVTLTEASQRGTT